MITEEDNKILKELGLDDISDIEKLAQLAQFYETLKIRVGLRVENELNDKQLEEVTGLMDSSSTEEVDKWLESHIENYEGLIEDELNSLKTDIKKGATRLNASIDKS